MYDVEEDLDITRLPTALVAALDVPLAESPSGENGENGVPTVETDVLGLIGNAEAGAETDVAEADVECARASDAVDTPREVAGCECCWLLWL